MTVSTLQPSSLYGNYTYGNAASYRHVKKQQSRLQYTDYEWLILTESWYFRRWGESIQAKAWH